jgi:hypothetical protein
MPQAVARLSGRHTSQSEHVVPVKMVPDLGCGPERVGAGGGTAAATEPGLGVKLLVLMPISAAAADVSCSQQHDATHDSI